MSEARRRAMLHQMRAAISEAGRLESLVRSYGPHDWHDADQCQIALAALINRGRIGKVLRSLGADPPTLPNAEELARGFAAVASE